MTAPIDGILSPLTIKVGQQIKPGEKVANLDNPHSYYFEASFSEYYLDKIRPHDRVTANYAGIDIPLLITSVSFVVENGKFIAKLTLAQPQQLSLKRGCAFHSKPSQMHFSFPQKPSFSRQMRRGCTAMMKNIIARLKHPW
ncbi:HlyD family efflux transporter periplasmic adaptor subunit [Candidatus Symbiopectobacterium sp. 'North America']|uniref:HlyD family efflux transporter periplasmic adaptor subunit n=1 Tax=Candidatus Symbiopectobacterium sp. 'North America' TaxID=2794574 RepID=UPI0024552692|nr:HlyD family efflux transporter periplasmic adaptor subunit [Candidatus Symbiopectobacterium sp. 'North America']